jgi:hypothetical protein
MYFFIYLESVVLTFWIQKEKNLENAASLQECISGGKTCLQSVQLGKQVFHQRLTWLACVLAGLCAGWLAEQIAHQDCRYGHWNRANTKSAGRTTQLNISPDPYCFYTK